MITITNVLLVAPDGALLMLRPEQVAGTSNTYKITPFGGEIARDEFPRNAVIRQLQEDLGFGVEPYSLRFIGVYYQRNEDAQIQVFALDNVHEASLHIKDGQLVRVVAEADLEKMDVTSQARDIASDYFRKRILRK